MYELGQINTRYCVDGFRSLRQFEVSMLPGINLIIGPNGSGKSNFIDLLNFLDRMFRQGATAAVSSAGGVARVFGIESVRQRRPKLSINVSGWAETPKLRDEVQRRKFSFSYSVDVVFMRDQLRVYIAKESLRLGRLVDIESPNPRSPMLGEIVVRRLASNLEEPPTFKISKNLTTVSPELEITQFNPLLVKRYSGSRPENRIQQRLQESSYDPDHSILGRRLEFRALAAVANAITRGTPLNISPERMRIPDDILRLPGISKDGSGLTATLHHLQQLKAGKSNYSRSSINHFGTPNSLDTIVEWTKLVIPSLSGISVKKDPFTGTYQGSLLLECESPLNVPFNSVSDGTLKWLSVACLVETMGGVYSIEEPENYLHPSMQQYLMQMIRESMEEHSSLGGYYVSSHSETIINACQPEELVIFEFVNGRTVARRVKNPDRVKEEVNSTGFGLGSYYVSGALS